MTYKMSCYLRSNNPHANKLQTWGRFSKTGVRRSTKHSTSMGSQGSKAVVKNVASRSHIKKLPKITGVVDVDDNHGFQSPLVYSPGKSHEATHLSHEDMMENLKELTSAQPIGQELGLDHVKQPTISSPGNLPTRRFSVFDNDHLVEEHGRLTDAQVTVMFEMIHRDPEQWSTDSLAEEFKLDPRIVKKLVHFHNAPVVLGRDEDKEKRGSKSSLR